jgi:conjugal transfer pilus assembly protein TraB
MMIRNYLQRYLNDWQKMDRKFKYLIVAVIVVFGIWFYVANVKRAERQQAEDVRKVAQAEAAQAAQEQVGDSPLSGNSYRALPPDSRNQGLETLTAQLRAMQSQLSSMQVQQGSAAAKSPIAASQPALSDSLPVQTAGTAAKDMSGLPPMPDAGAPIPPVNFDSGTDAASPGIAPPNAPVAEAPRLKMNNFSLQKTSASLSEAPDLVIPVNSGIEAVLLSGLDAAPGGAGAGAVGSVKSATEMGTPFVSKIKGKAILPNGWKADALGNCFLSGNGIANLNAERVNVIASRMSCINKDGEIYEGDVKAYGLDVDGIQGLAGHVVSKQGRVLMQAALTGMVSGLSAALTPTAVSASNTSSTGGQAQYQTPNMDMLAQSMLGTGLSQATSQLSRFYLQFASQVMPVIEVPAGSRVTWILTDSIKLKKARFS